MKFYVNAEKKTVVAVTYFHGRKIVGKAKCDQYDTFDEAIGKEIAGAKANAQRLRARAKHKRRVADGLENAAIRLRAQACNLWLEAGAKVGEVKRKYWNHTVSQAANSGE